ncbi:MAG: pantoate--beta-alanine ligase [Candidatus Goldiibacteriota bacterium HGW-Goldbacteria-1]|nr:MAG: pantoate--beta-alanine ligase [Candidatus Goldiibacteriota bacterium HGW-Goldbacteria-1]
MKIIRNINEMQKYSDSIRRAARKTPHVIGFVPTMGYLHEGHLSLVKAAAKESTKVVVSIFVNPAQFGPNEDFSKYPRDEERDLSLLEEIKEVDCVFIPSADEMYPEGYATYLNVENEMTKVLCGLSRPGHFKGVTTVVAKLINAVKPDKMFLGHKDMQQVIILTKMMKDMNYDTGVVICPTAREKDGLALSSRNSYLSPEERNTAPALYKSLQMAESMAELGERDAAVIVREIKRKLKEEKVEIDYVEVVNPYTLEKTDRISGEALIAAAIYVGKTRLIDNTIIRTND